MLAEEQPEASQRNSAYCVPPAGFLVLIVEDEEILRRTLAHWISLVGFRVVTAHDCRTAVEQVTSLRPHVMLLDLLIPGGGGLQVLRTLRAMGSDVPTVVLTGHQSPAYGFEAKQLGVKELFEKPLSSREALAEALRRAALSAAQDPLDGLLLVLDRHHQQATACDLCVELIKVVGDVRVGLLAFSRLSPLVGQLLLASRRTGQRLVRNAVDDVSAEQKRVGRATLDVLAAVAAGGFDADHGVSIAGWSPALRRELKARTGLQLHRWHRLSKLRIAVQELVRTDEYVSQIALACGFKTGGQLCRDVHRLLGCSPRRLRSRLSANKLAAVGK